MSNIFETLFKPLLLSGDISKIHSFLNENKEFFSEQFIHNPLTKQTFRLEVTDEKYLETYKSIYIDSNKQSILFSQLIACTVASINITDMNQQIPIEDFLFLFTGTRIFNTSKDNTYHLFD
jgi:hypothetical protein